MQPLTECPIAGKRVFLRIDANVPLEGGRIGNDFRLRMVLPTIEYLIQAGAQLTIGTHLGRPTGVDKSLSVAPIRHWFKERGVAAQFLENLRFDPREKAGDMGFAHELAAGHDIYVDDAWGTMHRADTSIALLPTLFAPENRAYGLLVAKELAALTPLRSAVPKPYLVFLGGNKEKIELLEDLINHGQPTGLVVLPAIAFSFLAAQGRSVGSSLTFPESFATCRSIIRLAHKRGVEILLPKDFFVEKHGGQIEAMRHIMDEEKGVTIGPETMAMLASRIAQARTIFYNGAMGYGEEGRYMLKELLTCIASSTAHTVIGGGDSVAAAERFGLAKSFSWCSTGGGSTLAFISGAQLPGLL